ncbi:MAG: BRO family protein [Methanothrix sp.]|nr:BRO family protein [Methanothrix sp.]
MELFTEAQHGWKLRKITRPDGETMVTLKDVCDSLQIVGTDDVKNRLDPEGIFTISQALHSMEGLGHVDFGDPRINEMVFIDVENVMLLVFQSRKPEAVAFSKWVRREVMASVLKTGSYSVPGAQAQQGVNTLEERVRMLISLEQVEEKVHAFRIKELEGQNLSYLILCLLKSKVFCPCQSASNFFPW